MRRIALAVAFAIVALAANPAGAASTTRRSEQSTVTLPPREPLMRWQSEIEAMSQSELIRWALPEHTYDTYRVELEKGGTMGGPISVRAILFFEKPKLVGRPAMCQVRVRKVSLRSAENIPPSSRNAQVAPDTMRGLYRYAAPSSPATLQTCAAATPYVAWFPATSAGAAVQAVATVHDASADPSRFAISCKDDDGLSPCDGADKLKMLTPRFIESVGAVACASTVSGLAGRCLLVSYFDPDRSEHFTAYWVTLKDRQIYLEHKHLPPW